MKENQKRYKHKCKQRVVTFYLCDKALYEYSKTINFSAFVKEALAQQYTLEKTQWAGE